MLRSCHHHHVSHDIRCIALRRSTIARALNFLRNIQTLNDMPEDGVIVRECRAIILEIDEELTSSRVWSGSLGHGNRTSSIIAFDGLIINAVAGATRAIPFGVTTLYNRSWKNTVELQPIEVMVLG